MPDFVLRPVCEKDVPELQQRFWQWRAEDQTQLLMRHMFRAMRREHGQALVVCHDEQIVGYGQVLKWGEEAEISELIIDAAYRGQGIGSALIRQLVQYARSLGVTWALIGVEADNPRALALYERLGFREDRRMALENRPDVIYLTLRID